MPNLDRSQFRCNPTNKQILLHKPLQYEPTYDVTILEHERFDTMASTGIPRPICTGNHFVVTPTNKKVLLYRRPYVKSTYVVRSQVGDFKNITTWTTRQNARYVVKWLVGYSNFDLGSRHPTVGDSWCSNVLYVSHKLKWYAPFPLGIKSNTKINCHRTISHPSKYAYVNICKVYSSDHRSSESKNHFVYFVADF